VSLWSCIQLAVLAALALAGSSIQVHHVDLAFRYDRELEIDLDPVFLIETDSDMVRLFAGREVDGFAFGDIAVICRGFGPAYKRFVMAHELTHVLQWRALGPWLLFFYNINPDAFEPHLAPNIIQDVFALPKEQWIPTLSELSMKSTWTPPSDQLFVWSFFKFEILTSSIK